MGDLASRITAARARLNELVTEVCGACQHNCCHQGTMMGTEGVRRLHKGLLLEPELSVRLIAGLARRQPGLQADVEVAQAVTRLLAAANLPDEDRQRLPELEKLVQDLQKFTDTLTLRPPIREHQLSHLLIYSAVRNNLLRCLRQFPGAEAALTTLAGGRGSFRFRGRKLAPPRCIYHQGGCLAEDYKPIKCANFFCTAGPNLLSRCREVMSFSEFVLANFRVVTTDFILRLVEIESELGPDYWEPKVIIRAGKAERSQLVRRLLAELKYNRGPAQMIKISQRFMYSINEIMAMRQRLEGERHSDKQQNGVYCLETIPDVALYEIAVAMDQARQNDLHGGVIFVAEGLEESGFIPHPLWEDEVYSQPLGALEMYYVTGPLEDD